jgi:ATP-dependent exoDNAse (exonuclease V) alpha subunit
MIAHGRSDVADVNQRARARLQRAGQLGADALDVDGRRFAVGDRITTTANDRRLGITNGTRATITAIDPETRDTTIRLAGNTEITLPASYVDAGNVDHGYATTAHRALGATVDHSFVLGSDDLYREWGYTALTRHRESATFYVNLGDGQEELPGVELAPRPPQEISATLSRSRREILATDRGVPAPALQAPGFGLER